MGLFGSSKIKSVVVFCSSSDNISPLFFSEMELLAKKLAENDIKIIYGGGQVGLMGKLADTALDYSGHVVGVIPKYLAKPGILHEGLTETIIVDDLLDRKRKMLDLADAAIACPGGVGTIDEITEVIALKQLHEHKKPVIFHNFLDFWNPLLDYFEELKTRGMIRENIEDLITVVDSADAVLNVLKK